MECFLFTSRAPIQLMQGGIQSSADTKPIKRRLTSAKLVPDLHQANPSPTVRLSLFIYKNLSRQREIRRRRSLPLGFSDGRNEAKNGFY
ncbi:hypothetical protein CARUB_v10006134mg [Capsella rubella]|uniref:Uncharacterized protein n=1 Tax=Capsella rubella TaxID=81985 RepID=R0F802_9BRAS|nr:hypothetical protein CARUB_v10006134mg [Capsella rubella]